MKWDVGCITAMRLIDTVDYCKYCRHSTTSLLQPFVESATNLHNALWFRLKLIVVAI